MILGTYPCCGEPLMLGMPLEGTPLPVYGKATCEHCGATVWHRYSRLGPVTWTEADFLARHDVNAATMSITLKAGRLATQEEEDVRDAFAGALADGWGAIPVLGAPYSPPRSANNHPWRFLMGRDGLAAFGTLKEVDGKARIVIGEPLPDNSPFGPKLRDVIGKLELDGAGVWAVGQQVAISARMTRWLVVPMTDVPMTSPDRAFAFDAEIDPRGVCELVGDVRVVEAFRPQPGDKYVPPGYADSLMGRPIQADDTTPITDDATPIGDGGEPISEGGAPIAGMRGMT